MQYDKLKSTKSFVQLRKKGSSIVTPAFVFLISKTQSDEKIKIGITTSKKVGNAVIRAKARRRTRAALNLIDPILFENLTGVCINIVCRNKSVTAEIDSLKFYLEKTLENVCKNFKKS